MADDDVSIKIGADISALDVATESAKRDIQQFQESVKSASTVVGQFSTTMKVNAEQVTAAFSSMSQVGRTGMSALQSPLVGITKGMAEIAAIAAGGAVFKSFIDSAVNAAGETSKLSREMGINLEQASLLRTELKVTGNTVEGYTSAALHLDRQVRTNESSLNDFGLATRDASGHLLNQNQLMTNAIEFMRSFKEGTDRTIASQTLFGRGASDVESLLRLNSTAAQRAKTDMEELGLQTDPTAKEATIKYKIAMGELNLAFEGIKRAIGEAVLPAFTKFSEWCRSIAPDAIRIVKAAVQDLSNVGMNASFIWQEFTAALEASFEKMKVVIPAIGQLALNALNPLMSTADWAKIGTDAGAALSKITDDYKRTASSIEAERERMRRLLSEPFGPPMPPKATEGGRSATDLLTDKGATDDGAKAAVTAAQERIRLADLEYTEQSERINANAKLYNMSEAEKTAELLAALDKRSSAEQAALAEALKNDNLSEAEKARLYGEALTRAQKYNNDRVKIEMKALEQSQKNWESALGSLQSAWDSQLRGLLAGTTSWASAMKSIVADLVVDIIKQFEKAALDKAALGLASAGLNMATGGIGGALFGGLSSLFGGGGSPTNLGTIGGTGGMSGFASGTDLVTQSGLAVIHQGEAIVPAAETTGPYTGDGASGDNITHNWNISTTDARSFAAMLNDPNSGLTQAIKQSFRNNQLRVGPSGVT